MTSGLVLDAADPATTELVLKLQLTDLEEIKKRLPGKQKEGVLGDLDVALHWMEEHLKNMQQILADKRIARSMAGAVYLDRGIIASFTHEEDAARQDRAYAVRLAGRPQEPEEATEEPEVDDTVIARLAGLYVSEAVGYDMLKSQRGDDVKIGETEPESSAWAAQRKVEQDKLQRTCVACMQIKQFFDLMPAPCTHEYCRDCLQGLFQSSFTDESLFPPRCCRQDIPLSRVAIFLNAELIGQYQQKKIEFSTPNRTYCSRATCSSFIRPEEVGDDVGTCRVCFARTCTICKMPAHDRMECPNDLALQAVDELAQQNGWQRCHACRRLVELEIGCNHMTCLCRAEFCYTCGARWKTCDCPQWNEERLLARANQVVNRDMPRLPANDPLRLNRVDQAVQMLRDRHNCDHRSWAYTRGRFQCEECLQRLPQYIFECRQCRIVVCNRCRRNRL